MKTLSLESLSSLSDREKRTLLIGGIAAAALLIFGILLPLDRSVTRVEQRLARKQADLAWMQTVAPELSSTAPPPSANGESLLVIIDRSARESGLAGALSGSEPRGPKALSLRLEKANFDTLITWLARLSQQNGVTVDSATIDKAGGPGLVNAALVLHSG